MALILETRTGKLFKVENNEEAEAIKQTMRIYGSELLLGHLSYAYGLQVIFKCKGKSVNMFCNFVGCFYPEEEMEAYMAPRMVGESNHRGRRGGTMGRPVGRPKVFAEA